MALRRAAVAALAAVSLAGCATLGQVVQPLGFQVDRDRPARLSLAAPSLSRPLGGATLRIHARVSNPNPVGLTLSRIAGTLSLGGADAAEVNFPLGLPLQAGQEATIPLDVAISFSELPGLADVARRAVSGTPIDYRLNGTFSVDAGVLGQPTFGPTTLLAGEARVFR